jgi:hemolysin III
MRGVVPHGGSHAALTVGVVRAPNFDFIHNEMRTRMRGVLHLAAALVSPLPTLWLFSRAGSTAARAAVLVYGLGFLLCVLLSGTYHRFARSERSQRILQSLDHAGIYLLVAGTYTPLLILGIPDGLRPWTVSGVWAAALGGVALRVLRRAPRFSIALYLLLGWLALPVLPALDPRAGTLVIVLLLLGGLVYTAGAVLFLRQRPRLRSRVFGFHEFWHAMTLLAGSAHFLAVAVLVSRLS